MSRHTRAWQDDQTHLAMQVQDIDPDDVLTAPEAAQYLKMTLRQFRELDQQGKFRRLYYGRKTLRYLRHDLIQAGQEPR